MEIIKHNNPVSILYPTGSNIQRNLERIVEMAKTIQANYDTSKTLALWARGSSGCVIASIMVTELDFEDVTICYIKKDHESSHQADTPSKGAQINIIVDDFICTGSTLESMLYAMKVKAIKPVRVDGICMGGRFPAGSDNYRVFTSYLKEDSANLKLMFSSYPTTIDAFKKRFDEKTTEERDNTPREVSQQD